MSHRDTSCVRQLDYRPDSNADYVDFGTHVARDCHVTGRRIHPTLQLICNSRCHTTTADASADSSGLNSLTLSETPDPTPDSTLIRTKKGITLARPDHFCTRHQIGGKIGYSVMPALET